MCAITEILPWVTTTNKSQIVCEWLLMPGESSPVMYHVDFADENYNTADHEMNILEMMAAFDGAPVDLGLALADAVFPGLIDPEKPLGDHIKLSEPGFTICRSFQNSRNLRLDGVFGKFSVSDVESWKPFREYANSSGLEGFLGRIEIPMPSIRLCTQDFFSTTGTRVSVMPSSTSRTIIDLAVTRSSSVSIIPSGLGTLTSLMRSKLARGLKLDVSLSLRSVLSTQELRHL